MFKLARSRPVATTLRAATVSVRFTRAGREKKSIANGDAGIIGAAFVVEIRSAAEEPVHP